MKAPFPYFGAKNTLAGRIVPLLGPHRIYLEPFFGSGAVFFPKPPAPSEIINDLDQHVVRFLRVLRERPDDLARVARLTPHARAEFDAADLDQADIDDLEAARRFWVRVNQSFAKTHNRRTGWSLTTARTQSVPASIAGLVDRLHACAQRLRHASIECCDAVDLIDRMATPDTVIYADPPYLGTARSNATGPTVSDYRTDMATEADHRRLADALRATPAAVLLSGYPSPLYDHDLYPDWHRLEIPTRTSSGQARQRHRNPRTEVIWSNRPLHAQQALILEPPTSSEVRA